MPPPSRRSHGLIRGKPQQAEHQGRARGSNEDGDADEEIKVDEDAPVVKPEILEEYLNRPIDLKTGEARLKQVSAELDVAFSGLKDAIGSLTEAALDVVGSLPTFEGDLDEDDMPEDPKSLKDLDALIRTLLDAQNGITIRKMVLDDLRQKLVQGHQITDILNAYVEAATPLIEQYQEQTSRQKYADDKQYKHFRISVFEARYVGQGIPTMQKFIPAEVGDVEDDSDDEIQVRGQQADYRCPITLGILVDPVRSSKCQHVFSRAAITLVLKQHVHAMENVAAPPRGHAPCPHSGCPAILGPQDLIADADFAKRVALYVQRQKEEAASQRHATQYHEISDDDDEE